MFVSQRHDFLDALVKNGRIADAELCDEGAALILVCFLDFLLVEERAQEDDGQYHADNAQRISDGTT